MLYTEKLAFILLNILTFYIFPVCAESEIIQLPKISIMPGMRTQWASEYMIYNGFPMSIRNFRVGKTEKEVLRYYESIWKVNSLVEIRRDRVGDEWVIGYKKKDFYYTVQVKNISGESEGSLVVTRLSPVKKHDSKFPLMPGSRILTHIHSYDQGIRAETITIGSARSVGIANDWYVERMVNEGWIRQEFVKTDGISMKLLEFQRGKELCQIRILPKSPLNEYRSLILVNWVKG
jgi:hypothetical protein